MTDSSTIPATGTIFRTWACFDFDKPGETAEAERLLRSHGYNTEIPDTIAEQAVLDCTLMLIWCASSECLDVCRSSNMLDKSFAEVERIIEPLGGMIDLGQIFDAALIDPDNWHEELFEKDFGRDAKPRMRPH